MVVVVDGGADIVGTDIVDSGVAEGYDGIKGEDTTGIAEGRCASMMRSMMLPVFRIS
jgi:hypothetical protein